MDVTEWQVLLNACRRGKENRVAQTQGEGFWGQIFFFL